MNLFSFSLVLLSLDFTAEELFSFWIILISSIENPPISKSRRAALSLVFNRDIAR